MPFNDEQEPLSFTDWLAQTGHVGAVPTPSDELSTSTPVPKAPPPPTDPTEGLAEEDEEAAIPAVAGTAFGAERGLATPSPVAQAIQSRVSPGPRVAPFGVPPTTQQFGFGSDLNDNALREAQILAQQNRNNATTGGAFAQIANSLAGSNRPTDQTPFEAMQKQAGQPVADLIARRQGAMQNLQLANAQQKADPNSPESKSLQNTVAKLFPGQFAPEDLAQINAGDFGLAFKPLELKEQIAARRAQMEQTAALRQAMLQKSLNEAGAKHQEHAQDRLSHDKEYTGAIEASDTADDLAAELEEARTNPASKSALPLAIARALVKARINQSEISAASGGQSLAQIGERKLKTMADGTLDPQDYRDFSQMIGVLKKSAEGHKKSAEGRAVGSYGALSGKSPEAAANALAVAPPQASPQQSPQGGKTPPNGAQSVTQRGHTYYWNPTSGQYE